MDQLNLNPALDFLHDLGTRIAAADPLHEVLDEIVEFVADLVSCDSCFIFVLEGDELVLRASKNPHPEALDRLKMQIGQGITGWVAEHREPVVLPEKASRDPRFKIFSELPEDAYEAMLSVPIVSRGRVVSVINVQNREARVFTSREVKSVSTIGHLVGAAIEMARLENEVTQLSDKLATRKIVERAKGLIQRELSITEEEAYSTIQKQARQRRKSMKEVSEAILLAHELKKGSSRPVS
ncbi:MAG: sensory transcriptional regulator [Acidobacteria bacterium]|nr:MAG: sensory transcriptional regulator [Acidobacteriota bacterium]PYY20932.1 MAG: sensory transcriptional regulator [Acidobacteriota bacterium]